jgi:hypothetical protein
MLSFDERVWAIKRKFTRTHYQITKRLDFVDWGMLLCPLGLGLSRVRDRPNFE